MKEHVLGLDLSLLFPAACIIPLDWDCDTRRVQVFHRDTNVDRWGDLCIRNAALERSAISSWVRDLARGGLNCSVGAESLPTRGGYELIDLAKLHCSVESSLLLARNRVSSYRIVNQSSARALFMGKVPRGELKRGDLKKLVIATVRSLPHAGAWTGDECDAFVVANYLLSELAIPCIIGAFEAAVSSGRLDPMAVIEKKPRTRKKAAA